jgi:hypothetical protein
MGDLVTRSTLTPHDLERIGFVAKRFNDLQGFRRVGIGASMVVGALVSKSVSLDGLFWFLVPFAPAFALGFFAERRCDRYYGQRFGRMTEPLAETANKRGWVAGALVAASLQVDARTAGHGIPSLTMVFMGVVPMWHLIRDWPHRVYLGIDVMAVAIASWLYTRSAPALHGSDAFFAYYWNAMLPLGTAQIVTGFLDHLLLSDSLHGGRAAEQEHADTI